MTNRLLIVGAGGFGREVLSWAIHSQEAIREWDIGGFLDSNPEALAGYNSPYSVVGDPWSFVPDVSDRLVCAIGTPNTKQMLCRHLESRGAHFVSLIHPTVVLGMNCIIGRGVVLCPGVVLTANVVISEFVTLNVAATVGHDASVGAWTTVSAHSDVTGGVRIGESVFLGSHACILPGAVIGDRAIVGAGSVVLRRVSPGTSVMGVPARTISTV